MSFFGRLEEMTRQALIDKRLPPKPATLEEQLNDPEMAPRNRLKLYSTQLLDHENSLRTADQGFLQRSDVLVPENLDNFLRRIEHDKDVALHGWAVINDEEKGLHVSKTFTSAHAYHEAQELLIAMTHVVGKSDELALFDTHKETNPDIIPIRKFEVTRKKSHTLVMPYEVMEAIWLNEGVPLPDLNAQPVHVIH